MVIIRLYESPDELDIKWGVSGRSPGLESSTQEWTNNKRERDALLLKLLKNAPKINTPGCRFGVVGDNEEPLASGFIANKVVRYTPRVDLKEV